MTKNSKTMAISLVVLVFFVGNVYGGGSEFDSLYSKETVSSNIANYMNVVFGKEPPSLYDYYQYESFHSENEYRLELSQCNKMWSSQSIEGEQSDKCAKWITERGLRAKNEKSLYYQRVRSLFERLPAEYKILDIVYTDNSYRVKVEILNSRVRSLSIYHSPTPLHSELGLIIIDKIISDD